MNERKYKKAVKELSKQKLGRVVENILSDAEDAWKLNRNAIRLIDRKNDEVKGEDELQELVDALSFWKISLEVLLDGSQKVAKRAHQALHSRGSNETPEGHIEKYGSHDPACERAVVSGKAVGQRP